jgi:hypothetical protein
MLVTDLLAGGEESRMQTQNTPHGQSEMGSTNLFDFDLEEIEDRVE